MKRLIVNGTSFSDPGTMGGNTKIFLELIRNLRNVFDVHVLLPDCKVKTVEDTIPGCERITLHPFPRYPGSSFLHPFAAVRHLRREAVKILDAMQAGPEDVLFSASDFHGDAAVSWMMQRRYGLVWLPSAFLFVPSPLENLRRRYGFPVTLYALAWIYSKVFMFFAQRRGRAFTITNEDDFRHFARRFREERLFPFYGGVNVEQIPDGAAEPVRDVVFCSRLCAQKGIMGFLEVWKLVLGRLPGRRFTLIGNGSPEFERRLHERARRLGVEDSIDWMGYVNNEAKYEIYKSAKVMVHPTIFDNNGMVAAEALCCGLPVVMYDLPALRHVYSTGCVKVPFGDRRRFADEVVRLLVDPVHRSQVAPTVEQVGEIREFWNWTNRVARYRDWLERVVPGLSTGRERDSSMSS